MLNDLDQTMVGQRTVVVGAGILGTTHALFALARGARVVHLERDLVPQGATVRNFGLVWVSGRASGAELTLALRSRVLMARNASAMTSVTESKINVMTKAMPRSEGRGPSVEGRGLEKDIK